MRDPLFFLSSFDIYVLIDALATEGAISVPLLAESARIELLREAKSFWYEPEVKTLGKGDQIVRTEYTACNNVPQTGLYGDFKQAFQTLMDEACDRLKVYPFSVPLNFNQLVIQQYQPGQLGITPHRDSLRAINLIALVNLCGEAEFYRCDDRQGTNSVRLDTTPGNIIFLRAPGFLNRRDRPFHLLSNIRSTRYSLGLRQRIECPIHPL
ncbi:MAG TPA: hypothetical protein IGS53_03630 [Leptolyngbyaceae cyanobacterium M33_DOE_097]|nr:hypothetical protein [Leptolyngbyaceae cyanobacterium M33_DOE_097]